MTEWPRGNGWTLARHMERYLSVGDAAYRFAAPREKIAARRTLRSDALLAMVRNLAQRIPFHGDLSEQVSQATAEALWERTLEVAGQLPEQKFRRAANAAYRLDGWQTVMLIARVLAENMRYPLLPIRESRSAVPWDVDEAVRTDLLRRVSSRLLGRERTERLTQGLETFELFAISGLSALKFDTQPLQLLAKRVLVDGIAGLCRHYAVLLQVLFFAAKRATGRLSDCHVVSVYGQSDFRAPSAHAWTWYVDESSNAIVTLDLTGADWLMDRKNDPTMFNRGFDATRWNNASAFLAMLMQHDDSSGLDAEATRALFAALVLPETVRGQALLFRLACHGGLASDVRRRIVHSLVRRDIHAHVPGWRAAVRLRSSMPFGSIPQVASSEHQHALLDATGL